MKTNKKVVLGFALAMVFSLAFLQGNSMKSTKQDVNVQQVSLGALYMSGQSEGGKAAVYGGIAAGAAVIAYQATTGGAIFSWNPVGWAAFGVAAGASL